MLVKEQLSKRVCRPLAQIEVLKYTRKEIEKVGEEIRAGLNVHEHLIDYLDSPLVPDIYKCRDKVWNWRAVHNYPMEFIKEELLEKAKIINSNALVVSRLKRLPSIVGKLRDRKSHIRLTKMQDISGCRVVFDSIQEVNKMIADIGQGLEQNRIGREKHYIQKPKESGYRSYHRVYSFESPNKDLQGLQSEIQIRTWLQHQWATAVEIIDHQKEMKLKFGEGSESWEEFFLLMSAYIANRENLPAPPNVPSNQRELRKQIEKLYKKNNADYWLAKAPIEFEKVYEEAEEGAVYIIDLLPGRTLAYVHSFRATATDASIAKYNELESQKGSESNIVLATASTFRELEEAFPNYVLDCTQFNSLVQEAIA